MTLSVCILVATVAFWLLNGGEDAPVVTQALLLAGIVASLLTMPLEKNVE